MCHQGQVLTLWHGRVLAIRWPNEFCAYVMRCRATDSHTLVRRAKSFGQDFVAGRYRPPPRRIGSDRIGTAAVTTSPASDAAGHLTKTDMDACMHGESSGRAVTGARPSHTTRTASACPLLPTRSCDTARGAAPTTPSRGQRRRFADTVCSVRPNSGHWQAMYKMSELNGNIYIALVRYIFPTLKKMFMPAQGSISFHF